MTAANIPELVSIELTNACAKACHFCYNASAPAGQTVWTAGDVVDFVRDCAAAGLKAVSFGGGEPLQFNGLTEILDNLRGVLFRSMTTNGLLLDARTVAALARTGIDKVHISIHYPHNMREVARVIGQVQALEAAGIRAGVNMLVMPSHVAAAAHARARLQASGIGLDRIVFLPLRGLVETPPQAISVAAGQRTGGTGPRFQSMTCLTGCARSPRLPPSVGTSMPPGAPTHVRGAPWRASTPMA